MWGGVFSGGEFPRTLLPRTPVNKGKKKGRGYQAPTRRCRSKKLALTPQRGEEALGTGNNLDRMASLLIHERPQASGAGRQLVL